ncbi:hypothetical protein EDF73_103475 [Raoultella sp. BIGb0138]|nr:hypothetical protein EDF73_103475 [Raoultella sp. BIGb0138]
MLARLAGARQFTRRAQEPLPDKKLDAALPAFKQ